MNSLYDFKEELWIEALSEMVKGSYLVEKCTNINPEITELTRKKYFAFKVDDISGIQKSKERMKECLNRAFVAIEHCLGTEILEKVSHSKDLILDFNFKVVELETLRLQDSFDTAIRGLILYEIKERSNLSPEKLTKIDSLRASITDDHNQITKFQKNIDSLREKINANLQRIREIEEE